MVDVWHILVAAVLSALRIGGETGDLFKDFAHLYTGGYISAWMTTRRKLYLWLSAAMIVVEVACFLIGKFL